MKIALFTIVVLSCSFGGLGDLTRPLYDKDYKAMYSTNHNLKELILGGPLSLGLGIYGVKNLTCHSDMKHQATGVALMIFSYIFSSATNCFGSTPKLYIKTDNAKSDAFTKI
ncbi:MAG: hypothetical protein KAH32_03755 [Chlamydiia bacterium]|nr:hypothetical protein [Chlamydiia bacterium]